MKIDNVEVKLYYNTLVAQEIDDLCGGIKNIGKLLGAEDEGDRSYFRTLKGVAKLTCILANGEVGRHNRAVALGLCGGEKRERYNPEDFEELLDAAHIADYIQEILRVMGAASQFVVPDGVKLSEPDIDLEEIEAEKNPRGAQPEA